MNAKGHTTIEYAICLGLLAVLAFGSLKLLGGNIMAILQAPVSGSAQAKTSQLYSLIGANIGGDAASTPNSGAGGQSVPATLKLSIDPNTGAVLTTTETTGGSKNTTSVPGDQAVALMSKQFQQLADFTMPDGRSVPTDVKALILKLMKDGVNLSDSYNQANDLMPHFNAINAANEGKTTGLTPYPSAMTMALGNTLGDGVQFQKDYLALHALLVDLAKTDPAINDSLVTPISQLAGGITSIAYNNAGKPLTENFNPAAASPYDLMSAYAQNPSLSQVVSPVQLSTTLALPPSQSGPAIQNLVSNAAQNTQVGFPPSTDAPVNLAVSIPTGGTNASGSMTGTTDGANSKTSKIGINNGGITASLNPTDP